MADRTLHPRPGLSIEQSLEESLVLALFDLTNHLTKRGERLATTSGLTTQQWLVLLQIARDPNFPHSARDRSAPLLASDIARLRGVSRATISAIVSALKLRGMVREESDPGDRRRRQLELTPAGVAALERVEPRRRDANRHVLRDLGQAERKQFLRYLQSCLAVLWDVHEDAQPAVRKQGVKTSRR